MKKPKEEKRRQRGSGSLFRKPPNKNWFIQFYRNPASASARVRDRRTTTMRRRCCASGFTRSTRTRT